MGYMFDKRDIEFIDEKDFRLKFDPTNLMDI
jgi:hypothetical protein